MKVTQKIKMDLLHKQNTVIIDVMQGDSNTRILEMSLYSGGVPWTTPEGVSVAIAYRGASGSGIYDTLPNGDSAYTISGNVVTAILIPQVMSVDGDTTVTIVFTDVNGKQLATFGVTVRAEPNPEIGAGEPSKYYNLREWVSTTLYMIIDREDDGSWSTDKDYDTIKQEYRAGREIGCYLEMSDETRLYVPFARWDGETFAFSTVYDGKEWRVEISKGENGETSVQVVSDAYDLQPLLQPLCVTITGNQADGYTADVSFKDILAAHEQGREVRCFAGSATLYSHMINNGKAVFQTVSGVTHRRVTIQSDGTVSNELLVFALDSDAVKTVNGVSPDKNGNVGVMQAANTNIRVVNHRGYTAIAPENTLSAYRLSKEMGFHYAECDIEFTMDGVPVLLHDETVDRTSNGSGKISKMTFAEVRALDFGSWKSEDYAGEQIPTFEEFIVLCKHIDLHPYIEIKPSTNPLGVKRMVQTVKRYGMENSVTWESFGRSMLGYVLTVHPSARVGLVCSEITDDFLMWATTARENGADAFINTNYSALTSAWVDKCIESGIPLEVWTINSDAALAKVDKYVSGITSDTMLVDVALRDAAIPQSQAPVENLELKNGQINISTATKLPVWGSNGNRAVCVSLVGGIPVYVPNSDGTYADKHWYIPAKPDGATKVTVVCPGLKFGVREFVVADDGTVAYIDSGWLAVGGAEFVFKSSDHPYYLIAFATGSGNTVVSEDALGLVSVDLA